MVFGQVGRAGGSVFLIQVIEQIDGAGDGIDTQGGDRFYHAGLATGFIDIEIHQCPRIAAKCISFLKAIVRSSASLTSLIPVSIVFRFRSLIDYLIGSSRIGCITCS